MATSKINVPTVYGVQQVGGNDSPLTINNVPTGAFLLIFVSLGTEWGLYATRSTSAGDGNVSSIVSLSYISSITLSSRTLTVTKSVSSWLVIKIAAL